MEAVTGVFARPEDARRVAQHLRSSGFPEDRLTILLPGSVDAAESAVSATEQPGMGKTLGGVVGVAAGAGGGFQLGSVVSALIPGVGPVIAIGIIGAALLGAAGGFLGAKLGETTESTLAGGLPEDELFVYEDALRSGRGVLIALADDERSVALLRERLEREGAEGVDTARERWWIGLRSAEEEHYHGLGGDFRADEKFYRLGFQAAMHARTRGKEYDQVLMEMQEDLDELKECYPDAKVEEPFRRGYERGRAHYESLRTKS